MDAGHDTGLSGPAIQQTIRKYVAGNDKREKQQSALIEAALKCLEQHGNNMTDAAAALESRVKKSAALRKELTDPLLSAACHAVVGQLVRVDRNRIIAHNRATRYMEKKLMRELWKAWRAMEKQQDETAAPRLKMVSTG